jgi:hypothetical protein
LERKSGEVEPFHVGCLPEALAGRAVFVEHRQVDPVETGMEAGAPNHGGLEDRLAWEARIFKERAQSLTYVCETPVLLEQRAFAIARTLAALI